MKYRATPCLRDHQWAAQCAQWWDEPDHAIANYYAYVQYSSGCRTKSISLRFNEVNLFRGTSAMIQNSD